MGTSEGIEMGRSSRDWLARKKDDSNSILPECYPDSPAGPMKKISGPARDKHEQICASFWYG